MSKLDELGVVKQRLEAARKMVSDLCHKRKEWMMSIPARPDVDPDLVIAASQRDCKALIERVEELQDTLTDTEQKASEACLEWSKRVEELERTKIDDIGLIGNLQRKVQSARELAQRIGRLETPPLPQVWKEIKEQARELLEELK